MSKKTACKIIAGLLMGFTVAFSYGGGTAVFYNLSKDGGLSTKFKQHTDWMATWSHIVPVNLNDDKMDDLLFYNQNNGEAKFYYNKNGAITPVSDKPQSWSKDWSSIVPVEVNDDKVTDLLFYNLKSGRGAFYSVNSKGGIEKIKEHSGWSKDWTFLVPAHINDDEITDILFYNSLTGTAKFYPVNKKGELGTVKEHAWTKGWQIIVPMNIDGDRYTDFLFYQSDGKSSLSKFYKGSSGGGVSLIRDNKSEFSPNWAKIVPLNLNNDGITDLLFYNAKGSAAVYAVNKTGGIMPTTKTTSWSAGWKSIVVGDFDDKTGSDLLFYK